MNSRPFDTDLSDYVRNNYSLYARIGLPCHFVISFDDQ
jgi:hypothetical protein